ncbi:MAG: glycosyltransferase family 2 protein [Candidatus Latescibacterota bacterium]
MADRVRPQVSIGLPLHQGSPHLRETVESLLGQSWRDFELVIVDASASPAVAEECRRLATLDARLRYCRRPGLHEPAEAYNLVFRRARGRYFRWTTCSEVYAADFLRQCVAALQRHGDAVLCYLRAKLIDREGKFVSHYHPKVDVRSLDPAVRFVSALRAGQPVCHTLGLVRSVALAQTGLVRRCPGAGRMLLAELALHGGFHPVPEYLLYARQGERPPARPARDRRDPLRGEKAASGGVGLRAVLALARSLLGTPLSARTRLACFRGLLGVRTQGQRARVGARSGGPGAERSARGGAAVRRGRAGVQRT